MTNRINQTGETPLTDALWIPNPDGLFPYKPVDKHMPLGTLHVRTIELARTLERDLTLLRQSHAETAARLEDLSAHVDQMLRAHPELACTQPYVSLKLSYARAALAAEPEVRT